MRSGEPGPLQPDVGLVVTRFGSVGFPVVGWTGTPGMSEPIVLVFGERKRLDGEIIPLLHDRAAWDAAWARHGPRTE